MLSVIIVTWNGRRFLNTCLCAVAAQLHPEDEIIVVDNGSIDGTAVWLRHAWPTVRLVALPTNLGFAGGVNAGLRTARGDLLLLLNNDAFVEPGCVSTLVEALIDHPRPGAVAGVLTFDHRPDLVASAGITARRDGLALDLWTGRAVQSLPVTPQPVMGASGGLALYRRTMLDDIGLMASDFFNYLEDVDLAWRAQLRGWECLVVPSARARHIYSATGGQGSPLKQRLLGRNRLRAIIRCFPSGVLRSCLPDILAYDTMALAYAVITRKPAMIAGRIEALRDRTQLLRERRVIQSRRIIPDEAFAAWLEPPPTPWRTMRAVRHLDSLLRNRSTSG
ncbi:MAG: glycosyltransferase family 2 protein [Roseiflexus sp.]